MKKCLLKTPQHQQPETMKKLNASPELFWPAGAFNAPTGSDYGVCYTVGAGGKQLSFHISSWHSLKHTVKIRSFKFFNAKLALGRTPIP
jgi:hypothetical protein